MTRILAWAIVACVLSACGQEEVLGWVSAIEAPEQVEIGQRFTVTVTTGEPDGCWEKKRTEVTISGLAATIVPYNLDRQTSGRSCTQMPVEILHTAELVFDQAGTAVIHVRGRDGTDKELSLTVQ